MNHTLLEFDEKSGWALVYTNPKAVMRYCVCYAYDEQSGTWGQGHYTDDISDAVQEYLAQTKAVQAGDAVGYDAVASILADADKALRPLVRGEFEPNEGIYRLNDMGEYVSEDDFESYWEGKPDWHRMAWMLADNGRFTVRDVASMSVEQIGRAYEDPSFEPEIAFYTTADEDGFC